jgi:RNA polymerase sigma-70 factor (ECF subfamily)
MSEAEIIRQCQKNNKIAQKTLFDANYNWLMHLSLRYAKNEEQAKQMLFYGYSSILSSISEYSKTPTSFDQWMKEKFISSAVQYLKNQKDYYITTTVHLKEVKTHGFFNQSDVVDEAISLSGKDVLSAIQELPPSFRSMFNMCTIDELELQMAATILDITIDTAKINLDKATFLFHQNINKNRQMSHA